MDIVAWWWRWEAIGKVSPCQLDRKGLISFIKECVGDESIVMGLSGGIDSSLSVYFAVQALGKEKVTVVILENSQFTKEGITLAKNFGVRWQGEALTWTRVVIRSSFAKV